ncbi:MAG TPA: tRNA glutamyl-Q(34) synthetase GluQRS [Rhodanobacteraceae bacterium]|nr:tRNA glutamyl-Q(34) synthetase GluQRS [Rhodanobacteraceae bacterium]
MANAHAYRGRFAPSPTGDLHFGSLLAALGSWLCARATNGTWLVRIEDIDPPREVPGSADSILRALHACTLEPDEPPLYQSTRFEAYSAALERLRENGQVFPCWCSRSDLGAQGGMHRGACVSSPDPLREPAWRVRVGDTVIAFKDGLQGLQRWPLSAGGDFVVKRADGPFAYQLACAVDDVAQGITEVVRGADLLDSTPRQIHLMRLLGLGEPAYLHLPVATDAHGRKLSKSEGAAAVDPHDPLPPMRAALAMLGIPPTALRARTPRTLLHNALAAFDPLTLPRAKVVQMRAVH